jgi:hypothetical protein
VGMVEPLGMVGVMWRDGALIPTGHVIPEASSSCSLEPAAWPALLNQAHEHPSAARLVIHGESVRSRLSW